MPPACARAMAMPVSVTVSMLALRIGMFSRMLAVSWVAVFTSWRELTGERLGVRSTSSNVNPFWVRMIMFPPKMATNC